MEASLTFPRFSCSHPSLAITNHHPTPSPPYPYRAEPRLSLEDAPCCPLPPSPVERSLLSHSLGPWHQQAQLLCPSPCSPSSFRSTFSSDVQAISCHQLLPNCASVTSVTPRQPVLLTEALAPGLGFRPPQRLLASILL